LFIASYKCLHSTGSETPDKLFTTCSSSLAGTCIYEIRSKEMTTWRYIHV